MRQVARRWPVVLLITLIAVAAGAFALSRREASYTSKATLVITPLAQYDTTFLGTSLIRDSGDATRTPLTVAKTIDSQAVAVETAHRLNDGATAAAVRDQVDVKPATDSNVVEIDAKGATPQAAQRLAATYAESALAVRWRTIDAELARRIATLRAQGSAAGGAGDVGTERTLQSVRRGGTDPTLKLQEVGPAKSASSVSGAVIVIFAILGGLMLGALAAFGIGRLGRGLRSEKDVVEVFPLPVLARVAAGRSALEGFDRLAVQIEAWAPEGGTVAVASPSAGDGRTTVAEGISVAIADGRRTAALVRLDADRRTDPGDGTARSVQQRLVDARLGVDFVVVDGPPLDADASALRATALADVVFLVIRLGGTGRRELAQARDLLEQTGVKPAGLILIESRKGPDRHAEGPGKGGPNGRRQSLMGMPLDGVTINEAVARVFEGLAQGRGGAIFTPNLEILRQHRRSPSLHEAFEEAELLVPDGMPIVWASRMQGTPVPQRVTGSDVMAGVTTAAAERGASIFLAGGRPGVAQRAAEHLAGENPGLRVTAHPCYIEPGPIEPQVEDLVHAVVRDSPNIVYVGLPFAAQVHLITALRRRVPRTWFVGVGSCFDLVNGDRPRAPVWLQRVGLEWAHRVVHEPRVWRRYVISGLPFAARLGFHALTVRMGRRSSTPA